MRVTLCQMMVVPSKEANISKAVSMITDAAKRGSELAILPEYFNTPLGVKNMNEYVEVLAPGNPTFDAMSKVARENNIWVIAGSIPEKSDGKPFNSSMVFDSEGNLQHVHRKIHLFRLDTDVSKVDESEFISPGSEAVPVSMGNGLKFGVAVCFDIRYPLLAWKFATEGTSFLVYPSAFSMVTGPLHMELTVKARAVDNQQYVILCSPAYNSKAEHMAWGHSMVVDPFGNVRAAADENETCIDAELDFDLVKRRRAELPILSGIRHDVYSLNWK